ncbi:MAG TPA: ABC transporter substrate-binding protein, partial [Candidatus Dormibacteraeota bacterium]
MRIASLLPSATELLFAIGAGPEVVGVTHECDFPPEAERLPRLTASSIDHTGQSCAAIDRHIRGALHSGSSIYRLDEELLARLRPDLIVTQELCEVCAVAYREVEGAARRLGGEVPVISLEPEGLDGIIATARVLGEATGHEREAEALSARMREVIAEVEALPAAGAEPPATACLEWTDPIFAG